MQPIRVLHIVSRMERGGVETMLMNFFRMADPEKLVFDFIVHSTQRAEYDDEIERLGGRIFRVRSKSESFIGNLKDVRGVVRDNRYHIVHVHQDAMSMFALKEARHGGAAVRIAHAHSTSMPPSLMGNILYPYAVKRTARYATHKFACSRASAQYLFNGDVDGVTYVPNGIDTARFAFSEEKRSAFRAAHGLGDSFAVGQIANFLYPKNHVFTLRVFAELLKERPDSRLVLCGSGPLLEECKETARALGLDEKVSFLGNISNVDAAISGLDALIMPSIFEGFPVSMVEAQCSGLPCFVSGVITRETGITGLVRYIPLDAPLSEWADEIGSAADAYTEDRASYCAAVTEKGYDIKKVSLWLQDEYIRLAGF